MKPLKNWSWTEKLILAGGVVAIGVVAGGPLLAGPVRAAVERRFIAHGPLVDRLVTRADEALELHLTDAQKQAVKPVLIDAFLQMRQLRHDSNLTPGARQATIKSLRETTRTKLAAILTPAQMGKLDAARARFDLGLSAEQKAQMKVIAQDGFAQARTIRDNASLNEEEKRLKLIDLHAAQHAKVTAILTPEQRRKAAARFDGGYLTNILAAELNLNGQQKPGVQRIVQSAVKQSGAVFAETGTTSLQKRDELRSIRASAVAKIDEILNPAQQKKLEEIKAIGSPTKLFGFGPGRDLLTN